MSFEWKNITVAEVGVTLVKEITNLLNRSILIQELFVFHKPGQWVKYVLISPRIRDLPISRCRRRYFSVRLCDAHVSNFFTVPIATKCREIVCGATESKSLICHTVEVDPALTFCRKWFTLHHTGQLVPGLWSIFKLPLRNLANNQRIVYTMVVPTPHALLTLATVAAADVQVGTWTES
ncbi:hypothetical protein TNIN_481851 [Trichonephila inaurata madagascariensis]|uniref:Uncharacterized protein n=1 Tax=Trichonephila inaurata madagascariensis TaxID=2747483 RepID=A0A8X6YBP1_9ARAC|nr:hypothetical protein TNIN_481851 [Trichonephila inaurata madagascariensis]